MNFEHFRRRLISSARDSNKLDSYTFLNFVIYYGTLPVHSWCALYQRRAIFARCAMLGALVRTVRFPETLWMEENVLVTTSHIGMNLLESLTKNVRLRSEIFHDLRSQRCWILNFVSSRKICLKSQTLSLLWIKNSKRKKKLQHVLTSTVLLNQVSSNLSQNVSVWPSAAPWPK